MIISSCSKQTKISDPIELDTQNVNSYPTIPIGRNYCKLCDFCGTPDCRCANLTHDEMECINGPSYMGGFESAGRSILKILNNLVSPELKISMVAPKLFRDSFLENCLKGRQYQNYYYYISQFALDSGISISDIPAHLSFANASIQVADSLTNGQPSCIPFTVGYKSDALSMIYLYRNKYTSLKLHSYLDSITNDLNTYTGLTKSQVYSLIND